jgi:hypothetical protein
VIAAATGTNAAHDLAPSSMRRPSNHHVSAAVSPCEQVVEHRPEFLRERTDAHVSAVDQFAAEFDHLARWEMVAQAEHAAADARLRFEHAHRHARLAQAPRGGEARDAGADDHDRAPSRVRARRRCAGGQRQARRRALQQAAARGIDAQLRGRGRMNSSSGIAAGGARAMRAARCSR